MAAKGEAVGGGPSPRGWGERALPPPHLEYRRTIPTRVGRTPRVDLPLRGLSDHPHAGGENLGMVAHHRSNGGPSPRGWGERPRSVERRALGRTIPTRVGRTVGLRTEGSRHPDHPHAGGENSSRIASRASHNGPSPRGWGELTFESIPAGDRRTIPTRVGRTSRTGRSSSPTTDHPHAGGENAIKEGWDYNIVGPSPRGWGELHHLTETSPDSRTIPTRVGRTM